MASPNGNGDTTDNHDVPRKRLEGLMLIRVVVVTIFLGSALAIDTQALTALGSVKNVTLLSLIVGTYLLTIAYALALKRVVSRRRLAITQISLDVLITGVLAGATSGLDSVFVFLFYMIIINAAVVLGQRAALVAALVTCVILSFFAGLDLGYVSVPGIYGIYRPSLNTVFRLSVNGSAAIIVALLAGFLAESLGQATQAIARQEADIKELKALNANILASLASGLLTIDSDNIIIFWNAAAESITGMNKTEVLGRPLKDVLPALTTQAMDRQTSRREFALSRAGGGIVYLGFSTSPLLGPTGETAGRIINFQDLTDVRKLEQQMRQSERLAAVGQLSAAIAHEIRNPLASISGAVEMLDATQGGEDTQALSKIVVREVDRLDGLITDFLEYCRPHELELIESDLSKTVQDVVHLFTQQYSNDVRCNLPTEPALACFDREATTQILWNLLNNAREADPDSAIAIAITRTSDTWVLSVEDSGPGVSQEARARIFEPFFTTKAAGTGLGLATIFRLAEEQGGTISLETGQNLDGARFEVRIPAA